MSNEKPVLERHESTASIPSGTPIVEVVNLADDSKPPDGGYGWICCISCVIINGFTWGLAASFGVYLSYYIDHDIFPGASDIDYALIGGVNFSAALLVSPLVGPIMKRFGTNVTMLIGCVVYAAGWITASFAQTFWQLCLSQGLCIGLGIGVIWQPSITILPQWFSKKRSLAQGYASCGSGIGGVIFSLATTPMIEKLSLAWSLRITGIISTALLVIASLIIKDRNAVVVPNSKVFDLKLLKRYQSLLLIGWGVTSILGYIVMLYSLSSYAINIGLTQTQGGIIIALQNVGTALGRPFIGVISDRYGRMTTAAAITILNCILAFAVWIPARNYGTLAFLGLISGATIGVYWSTIAPLCAEVAGLVELPSMLSLNLISVSMPSMFSEVVALKLRKPGSDRPYLYPQIYAGIAFAVSAAFMVELRRSKWGLWTRERHT